MSTTTFKLKDLSQFYKNSKFYNDSLSEYDEDEDILIDKRYWIEDFSFLDHENTDLKMIRHVADVYRFWGIRDIHPSFYQWLINHKDDYGTFFEDYDDFPDIYKFKEVVLSDNSVDVMELEDCIKTGSLPILKYFYSKYKTLHFYHISHYGKEFHTLAYIAEVGNIECLKFAYETKTVKWTNPYNVVSDVYNKDKSAVHISAKKGNYECMVFAIENGATYEIKHVSKYAIKSGNVNCVKYLYEKYGDIISIHCNNVIKRFTDKRYHRYKDIIFYLTTKKSKNINYDKIYQVATKYNRLDLIKHLYKLGIKIPYVLGYCCTLETLKFFVEKCGKNINNTNIAVFAERGYLGMIKYAVEERGCIIDNDVMEGSIEANKFNCFKYLLEKKCPFDYDLSDFICAKGTVEFLKYIIELGYNISPSAIYFAFMEDNISCFKYLIEELNIELNPLLENTFIHNQRCQDYLMERSK